jgi:hypothetical protein
MEHAMTYMSKGIDPERHRLCSNEKPHDEHIWQDVDPASIPEIVWEPGVQIDVITGHTVTLRTWYCAGVRWPRFW